MHLEQTGNTLFLVRTRYVHIRTRLNLTGINTRIAQTSHERVRCNLKCQCRQRSIRLYREVNLLACTRIRTLAVRDVQRIRQISDHRIQQILNALVLERRTAHHRTEIHGNHRLADHRLQVFHRNGIRILEETLHQSLILYGSSLHQFLSPFLGFSHHILGNLLHRSLHGAVLPHISFHLHQVHNSLIRILRPDRQHQRHRIGTQFLFDFANRLKEIGSRTVHLVHESDSRHAILVCLAPYRLGLRFHATHGTEQCHGTVQHTQ